jgi:hypothetical protein
VSAEEISDSAGTGDNDAHCSQFPEIAQPLCVLNHFATTSNGSALIGIADANILPLSIMDIVCDWH